MATADQLKALIKCHVEGDDARFYTIALQLAALEARNGHTKFAQELRDLVDAARAQTKLKTVVDRTMPVPLVQPRGELVGLLSVAYPKSRLADLALPDPVRQRVERVTLEQRQQDRIREHGYVPQRKLLLIGPPGTGKTLTASALAGELALPLFTILLDGLITKFMGETAAKLRLIFEAIQQTRGVFLFDEFDALGGERSARNDVGEIRRVLNSFLQFLEQDNSDGLIVAATNHVQLLDHALFRRFDTVIEYTMPSADLAEQVMRARLAPLDTSTLDWTAVVGATERLSHADIARACDHAAKHAILGQTTTVETAVLISALEERRSSQGR